MEGSRDETEHKRPLRPMTAGSGSLRSSNVRAGDYYARDNLNTNERYNRVDNVHQSGSKTVKRGGYNMDADVFNEPHSEAASRFNVQLNVASFKMQAQARAAQDQDLLSAKNSKSSSPLKRVNHINHLEARRQQLERDKADQRRKNKLNERQTSMWSNDRDEPQPGDGEIAMPRDLSDLRPTLKRATKTYSSKAKHRATDCVDLTRSPSPQKPPATQFDLLALLSAEAQAQADESHGSDNDELDRDFAIAVNSELEREHSVDSLLEDRDLRQYLLELPHATPRPTDRNPKAVKLPTIETATFCRLHDDEAIVIPEGRARGWPREMDWNEVAERVSGLRPQLSDIILNPDGSHYFSVAKEEWLAKGARKIKTVTGEFDTFEMEQPGYYGSRGREIISQQLISMFCEPTDPFITPSKIAPVDKDWYIRRVLIPETAILLIVQDQPDIKTHEDARALCEASRAYGRAMFSVASARDDAALAKKELRREQAQSEKERSQEEQEAPGEEQEDDALELELADKKDECRPDSSQARAKELEFRPVLCPPPSATKRISPSASKKTKQRSSGKSISMPTSSASPYKSLKSSKQTLPSSTLSPAKSSPKKRKKDETQPSATKKLDTVNIDSDGDASDSDLQVSSPPKKTKSKPAKTLPSPKAAKSMSLKEVKAVSSNGTKFGESKTSAQDDKAKLDAAIADMDEDSLDDDDEDEATVRMKAKKKESVAMPWAKFRKDQKSRSKRDTDAVLSGALDPMVENRFKKSKKQKETSRRKEKRK
ncbi:hypothetical protein OIO90_003121 [Microbotryomycetes sp. JL221]|nr:hypothetical protein OIO90_003121 [Microbotryomycetes sp. JL221]